MTEQQKPHKWQEQIVAWADGAKVERRQRMIGIGFWKLCPDGPTPNWNDPDLEFRIHDPYRELREAEDRGEVVEYQHHDGVWYKRAKEYGNLKFVLPPDHYRIAKPAPKEEELYVLVHDRNNFLNDENSRPTVFEQLLDRGSASLEEVKRFKNKVGNRYGKTRIARLVFIDIGEN